MSDVLNLIVGAAIGFATSRWYYQRSLWDAEEKAAADRKQAEKHTLMLTTLLRSAARAGHVNLTLGPDGNITGGETIEMEVGDSLRLRFDAKGTLHDGTPKP